MGVYCIFVEKKFPPLKKKSSNSIIKTLRPFVGISAIIDFIFTEAMDSSIHLDWDLLNFREISSPDVEATFQH